MISLSGGVGMVRKREIRRGFFAIASLQPLPSFFNDTYINIFLVLGGGRKAGGRWGGVEVLHVHVRRGGGGSQ